MRRISAGFMLCGFVGLGVGCYERPDPLAGGTEAGSSTDSSTTTSQGSTSDESATTAQLTTGASTTSSTTSASDTTGGSESDSGPATDAVGTGTDTEDTGSSSGGEFVECDPLLQNCGEGEGCYSADAGFGCQPDASGAGGTHGDECAEANECSPGSVCVTAKAVGACDAGAQACCAALCSLSVPECPGVSPVCTAWFDPGPAPTGLEDVGVCTAD